MKNDKTSQLNYKNGQGEDEPFGKLNKVPRHSSNSILLREENISLQEKEIEHYYSKQEAKIASYSKCSRLFQSTKIFIKAPSDHHLENIKQLPYIKTIL